MMTRFALPILLAAGVLGAMVGRAHPAASTAGPEIAWGKEVDGLKVGFSCERAETTSEKLPTISLYLANAGSADLWGVLQRGDCCMIVVNGRYYFQPSYGGPSSSMQPGRTYGPIPVDADAHLLIEDLRSHKSDSDAARAELKKGTNTISVSYMYLSKLVQSGEIKIIRQ